MTGYRYEVVAAQLIRALRGRRSQKVLSRRLRCRSNVLYTWESGRRWPTAARFFQLARLTGLDLHAIVTRFHGRMPARLARIDLASRAGVAALIDELRGARSIAELARVLGCSRSSVSRWLRGRTEPQLPDLLMLIEATTLRLLDFIGELVDPARIDAVAERWHMLEASRRVARETPWANAVLRALELQAYQRLPRHEPGWIAQRLGLGQEAERSGLSALEATGQVHKRKGRFVPADVMTVDTRRDLRAEYSVRAWSARIGLERMQQSAEGVFSYNVFTVSEADLARLQELQRAFFRQFRAIVAASEPAERVAIANVQLFCLDRPEAAT
jgi:transcriptional regulator with XRE-family HTH domain